MSVILCKWAQLAARSIFNKVTGFLLLSLGEAPLLVAASSSTDAIQVFPNGGFHDLADLYSCEPLYQKTIVQLMEPDEDQGRDGEAESTWFS